MTGTFKLTGWHVLAMLVAFFLAVIAANAIFITLAVRSFPGEQEKKSYLQGLSYNEKIKAREAQEKLGWRAELARASLDGAQAEIDLYFSSSAGDAVSNLSITGILARPAVDDGEQQILFVEIEPGRYRATASGLAAGAWRLAATATSPRGESFTLEKRLILERPPPRSKRNSDARAVLNRRRTAL